MASRTDADRSALIRKLNDLIELDHDAIVAYRAAIERLESEVYRRRLAQFCEDHERHTQQLGARVEKLGGRPAKGPDAMRLLTKGKVLFADLVGNDHAILFAMRTNEEVTNRRYELAIAMDNLDAVTMRLLKRNLSDERRHRRWLVARLDRKPTSRRRASTGTTAKAKTKASTKRRATSSTRSAASKRTSR